MEHKYYEVFVDVTWFDGGLLHEAKIIMRLWAKSQGHAISRAKDALAKIGNHDVRDIGAIEVKDKA